MYSCAAVAAAAAAFPSIHLPAPVVVGRRFTTALRPSLPLTKATHSHSHSLGSNAIKRTVEELNQGIADLYDSSSPTWENVWGDHMHHGYYDSGLSFWNALQTDHIAAQVRMIEQTLAWAEVPEEGSGKPRCVLDVGCGIGGSSRHLANKYGSEVKGITLSQWQSQRATALTASAGLSKKVSFQVADALNQPFPDNQFDLVWSMESAEHMPDKQKFLQELTRVAAPGGRIIIVTWCHRDLLPGETSLKVAEQRLLDKICDAYYLPAWYSPSGYVNLAQSMNLQDIKSTDWSDHITPFWPAVLASVFTWKGLFGLLKSGRKTLQGALATVYMVQGYNIGLIKFFLITACKVA